MRHKILYTAQYRVLNLGYIIGYKILCRRMLGVMKLLQHAVVIDLDSHIRWEYRIKYCLPVHVM